MKKTVILEEKDITEKIEMIARKIVENNSALKEIVLVGIRTGGAYLAARLQKTIGELGNIIPLLGILDIT
ncbi:MAG: bifunctional pyr operon transcriptional regulator/uracil phosphoribosyltransferase, partial [Deltaproteobacteria bacterium]|nr:bifunctional pyr operon transcriptional regulator/uracil phosphoribosyltransferase [Deltaproteobacteria bacterium]